MPYKHQGIIDRARSPFCTDNDINEAVEFLVHQAIMKERNRVEQDLEIKIAKMTKKELAFLVKRCKEIYNLKRAVR